MWFGEVKSRPANSTSRESAQYKRQKRSRKTIFRFPLDFDSRPATGFFGIILDFCELAVIIKIRNRPEDIENLSPASMFLKQSNSAPHQPLIGPLAAVLAAFIRWLTSRLSPLFSPVLREARGQGRFNGRFNGRFETPRKPLAGTAQPESGYDGYSKATVWSACAGPWARDVATGGARKGRDGSTGQDRGGG